MAYRCLHSHGDLGFKTKDEFVYTGMTYGFVTNLIYMCDQLSPDFLVIAWDSGSKYRRNLYPLYKQKRRDKRKEQYKIDSKLISDQIIKQDKNFKPPHNILKEITTTINITGLIGIPQYRTINEEADDVIGSLVKKYYEKYRITIASNDHDFMQLLKYKDVTIFKSYIFRGKSVKDKITKRKFIKKYGFDPKYYPNLLALTGDRTDEYPGVKGIGEKTAVDILTTYGPELENVIKNCENENILPRWSKLILKEKEMMFICKRLARIRCNMELNKIEQNRDLNLLKDVMKNLRFHSLLFEDKFETIKNLPHSDIML